MHTEYNYGRLDLNAAHSIAGGANSLLMALQEYTEAGMLTEPESAKLASKGVDLGDALLDMARMLIARGVFKPTVRSRNAPPALGVDVAPAPAAGRPRPGLHLDDQKIRDALNPYLQPYLRA